MSAAVDYQPEISIVIPVYNEEPVLPLLFQRLFTVMDGLGRSYEIIFVDDGSRDRTAWLLQQQFQTRPDRTRVVILKTNFGQHAAVMAGFSHSLGRYVITLDADLQNPPEEIPKIIAKMDEGYDYVGSIRRKRQDVWWRQVAGRLMNHLRERLTRIRITDQGCMLRGYHRDVIAPLLSSQESFTFIPALGFLYAGHATEVVVEHEERAAGRSKYSLFSLIQLYFDLMTGFSAAPLRIFSLTGIGVSIASFCFVVYLTIRRLVIGPEMEGLFTLFAILFFLIGISLFGMGMMGEYLGRIYHQTKQRPRYLVRTVLQRPSPAAEPQ
ncbi:glycosyltransferase [Candidatus Magnetaquicoccus inordinatus]|uniref:glycosyltransferase n=1 Tax=Candidatus Magnetaquicoccus inordinatus TaxID=2496818 RepID=UPI00102AD31E|nr:glycosyltransferase [Candidatus Magnetaquicoccus inordinatus]